MSVLGEMFTAGYIFNREDALVVSITRSFQWSNKNGICKESPLAYARMGMAIACSLGDYDTGVSYGDAALKLLEFFNDKRLVSMTHLLVFATISHWLRDVSVKPLLDGYEAGMAVGDTETAFFNIFFYLDHQLYTGIKPLSMLLEGYDHYASKMEDHGQISRCYMFGPRQAVANLIEGGSNPARLVGRYMDEEKFIEEGRQGLYGTPSFILGSISRYRMMTAFFFEDFECLFKIREEFSEATVEKVSAGQFGLTFMVFTNALAAVSQFRTTRHMKYKHIAAKLHRKLTRWVAAGVSANRTLIATTT